MSETKFTKGEWVYVRNINHTTMSGVTNLCNPPEPICLMNDCDEEAENGKLLAAAPELLKQLVNAKKIIRLWHNMGKENKNVQDKAWKYYNELSPEMKAINDAINKATL